MRKHQQETNRDEEQEQEPEPRLSPDMPVPPHPDLDRRLEDVPEPPNKDEISPGDDVNPEAGTTEPPD